MKEYEYQEAGRRFLPLLPICARIDGKCFSRFTQGLSRPYDQRLSSLMCETTTYLVKETQACIGYTQSDEINLIFYSDNTESQIFFDRRIQKMTSVLSSMATAFFNKNLIKYIPEKQHHLAIFDCRVWTVPTLIEAANTILWREYDAVKNSISMAARYYYSHKELHNKTSNVMQEMLYAKGINWNDYPPFFKHGTFIQKRKIMRTFTEKELETLPEKHKARTDKNLQIERTDYRELDILSFSKVVNKVGVVFIGEDPVIECSI